MSVCMRYGNRDFGPFTSDIRVLSIATRLILPLSNSLVCASVTVDPGAGTSLFPCISGKYRAAYMMRMFRLFVVKHVVREKSSPFLV